MKIGDTIWHQFGKLATIGLAGAGVLALGACDDGLDDAVITDLEYEGNFQALNGSNVDGVANIVADEVENSFSVVVEAGETAPDITHAQHIHAAGVCPTMEADGNGDGFLDVVEGLPSYGGILIPLDSDLTEQAAGEFPMADGSGLIDYDQFVGYDALVDGITGEDSDIYVELGANEALAPEIRTVVLHGVPADTELPSSVQSIAGLPAAATLPVACAELTRVPSP